VIVKPVDVTYMIPTDVKSNGIWSCNGSFF